jgi:hypothetical protein
MNQSNEKSIIIHISKIINLRNKYQSKFNKQGGIASVSGLNFLKSYYKNHIANRTFDLESIDLGILIVIKLNIYNLKFYV